MYYYSVESNEYNSSWVWTVFYSILIGILVPLSINLLLSSCEICYTILWLKDGWVKNDVVDSNHISSREKDSWPYTESDCQTFNLLVIKKCCTFCIKERNPEKSVWISAEKCGGLSYPKKLFQNMENPEKAKKKSWGNRSRKKFTSRSYQFLEKNKFFLISLYKLWNWVVNLKLLFIAWACGYSIYLATYIINFGFVYLWGDWSISQVGKEMLKHLVTCFYAT